MAVTPFDPTVSTLLIPNQLQPVNGVSDATFLNQLLPYASRISPITRAQQQVQQEGQPE